VEYAWEEVLSEASVKVRQVQQVDELTPIFVLPCDLVFYTARGRQVRRVMLTGAEESYHFVLDSEPRIVEFDPEERLLKTLKFKKKGRALLLNQLEASVDASSRARAARDLAAFSDDETIEALKKAIVRGQFWAVGVEAARSLGQIGTGKAMEVLLELVEATGDRKVRRGIVAALAEFKGNEKVHDVLKRVLFNDASPYIRCEAALSLAKSGAKDAVAVLTESMKLPSPEYGITEASLEALGYVKGSNNNKEARHLIREHIRYGYPTRVRIGAVKGYMKLGSLEDEDVQLVKEIAVRDPDFFVRDQVLELVAELADKRFVGTLGKVSEADIDRRNRRRAIEVLQDILSQDASSAVSSLREDVEKLKGKNKELGEKLAGLERAAGDRK
jgi:aminopeptidase N